jgi:hypothetical protein
VRAAQSIRRIIGAERELSQTMQERSEATVEDASATPVPGMAHVGSQKALRPDKASVRDIDE